MRAVIQKEKGNAFRISYNSSGIAAKAKSAVHLLNLSATSYLDGNLLHP